jgi:hypothetical protein
VCVFFRAQRPNTWSPIELQYLPRMRRLASQRLSSLDVWDDPLPPFVGINPFAVAEHRQTTRLAASNLTATEQCL